MRLLCRRLRTRSAVTMMLVLMPIAAVVGEQGVQGADHAGTAW